MDFKSTFARVLPGTSAAVGAALLWIGAGAADPLDPSLYGSGIAPDSDSTAAYNLRSDRTFPGWAYPVVPRNTPAVKAREVPLPSSLPGNVPETWLNYGTSLFGSERVARLEYRVQVDDDIVLSTVKTGDLVSGLYLTTNAGPVTVGGGRHTVTVHADPENRIRESDESDNVWRDQFVWSPLFLSFGSPVVHPAPPPAGDFPAPNCDGFELHVPSGAAWVVAAAPQHPHDDYDLYLYDDYSGARSGFENVRAASFSSGNGTDFVVGHRSDGPLTFYPGTVRFRAEAGEACRIDAATSLGRTTTDLETRWEEVTLPASRLADVYEGYFIEGVHYRFHLVRNSGASDLSFNIYPPDDGGIYGRNDQALVAAGDYGSDVLEFDAPSNGWYPVVVYRSNGSEAAGAAIYTFYWLTGVAGIPDEAAPRPFQLEVGPNPMASRARIAFSLRQPGATNLGVWDVLGRRVRLLLDRADLEAGPHEAAWDGRRDDGSPAPAGIYWVRLDGPATEAVRRIVRAR